MFDGSKKAENMMSFQIHNNIVAVTCTKSFYHIYIKGYIFFNKPSLPGESYLPSPPKCNGSEPFFRTKINLA